LDLLEAAAQGVAAGHRAGIVHRDLKPSNIIIVDDHGVRLVKIVDFGIAKALLPEGEDDLTRTGHVPHSPAYASPEQVHGTASLTPAADVYQLGLIGYELLAGERPFTTAEQARIRAGDDPGIPVRGRWGEVPEGARRVVETALSLHPEERYPDATAFAAALAATHEGRRTPSEGTRRQATAPATEVAAAAPGARGGARRRLSRRAAIPAVVAALLLLWLALRGGEGPGRAAAVAAYADAGEADAEFRALRLTAQANLARAASPPETLDPATTVGRVVEDLVDALVDGDIERHVSHYADRVRFYGRRRDRADVARSRAETMAEFPAREVTLARTAITFPEPGEARVLVDKSWDYRGDERSWTGATRTEYVLELEEGDWLVTAERDVDVYRERRSR
jgi:hypothetical protein